MTSPSSLPLYAQNPLGRFSDRAEDYACYRPSYPPDAIDCILNRMGEPSKLSELVVADVGAGTGISARLMAEKGLQVWAIEPNAAMRDAATSHPNLQYFDATAEQTQLPDQSVDIVLCCQSFHWFNKPIALAEFHRILKPSGRVALMWNDRDLADPFTKAYSSIVSQAADRHIFDQSDRKSGSALSDSPFFTNFQVYHLHHTHRLDLQGLIGLVLSSSYIPKAGAAYEQLLHNLKTLYWQWNTADAQDPASQGAIELAYRVDLYIAERAVLETA